MGALIANSLYLYLVLTGLGLAVVIFVALFFVAAPYGKHAQPGWGPRLPNHLGWMLMDITCLLYQAGIPRIG